MNEYLDVVARTAVVYVSIVGAIIFFGRKELAQLSIIDLVLILLISNSVQNAMVGPSTSLGAGLVSAGTIFVLNFIIKWLIYNVKFFNNLVEGDPIVLIINGHIIDRNLRKQRITYNELDAAVREHGIDNVDHVKMAMLEIDGNISVVGYSDGDDHSPKFNLVHHRKNKKVKKRI